MRSKARGVARPMGRAWSNTARRLHPTQRAIGVCQAVKKRVLFVLYKDVSGLPWVAQLVKSPPAMQETPVPFLGREDPLERKWQPTPVFLPGKFHGQRNLGQARVHGVTKSWTRLSA